ncbi:hypothetical protein ACOMHN_021554 [Nucella lapillus]
MLRARESKRPAWWPHILPWTQERLITAVKMATPSAVRAVAKKVCRVMAQGSPTPLPPPAFTHPRVLDWINSQHPDRVCLQTAKSGVTSSPKKSGGVPYLDIYLCHLCNAEFSTKEILQKHQVQCQGAALPSTPPVSEAPSPAPPASAVEDSRSVSVASAATSPSSRSSVSQSHFIAALDLVPFHRARKIRQARRRNTECETIDLEEPHTPVSPSTPRSHKTLLTQLSRDASSNSLSGGGVTGSAGGLASRRSSFLRLSVDKRPDNVGNEKEEEQAVESDRESSESGAEDADEPKLRKKTLFSIDVSSGLGQRIIKHMTSEINVPVISDLEEYCRTPIKDKYQDRLRIRQTTYPVTWKLTRKRQQQFCRVYKFTRADKLDFEETMRTGLNLESRRLRDSLGKCSVVVKRLSTKTLLKWNRVPRQSLTRQLLSQARAGPCQTSVFPQGPTFLLTDVDRVLGLKRKDVKPELARKLLASHCVSENANAEMQSQKLTVYRCLLTDLYSSVTSDQGQDSGKASANKNKEGLPQRKQTYPALLSILSGSPPDYQGPFEDKASHDGSVDVKKPLKIDIPSPTTGVLLPGEKCSSLDDSFSVKTLSSDEDVEKSAACCTLCTVRNKCKCLRKESASAALDAVTSSPALSAKVSSMSKSSLSPPELAPLSLTPKVSAASYTSLSPPNLSPVSQGGDLSSQSSSVAHRLSTRRSTLLLKTSASFPKASASSSQEPETGRFQCPSAPSPSQALRRRRDDCTTSTQALSSPTMAKRSRSSPSLSASSSLLQPAVVSDTLRPHTRSSSKQKVAGESSDWQQKLGLQGLECSCRSTACAARQSSVPTHSVGVTKMPKELASSSRTSPSVPSSVDTDGMQSSDGQGIQLPNNPKEKNGQKFQSSSCKGSADAADAQKEGKEVVMKAGIETTEGGEKQTVRSKIQTRGSLREGTGDKSQRSEERKDMSESRQPGSQKQCGAGDVSAKAAQKVELTKNTQGKNSAKMLRKVAEECVGKKDEASSEQKHSASDDSTGDRETNGGRALRTRERKHSEKDINKQTSEQVKPETGPEMKIKESKHADQEKSGHCKNDGEMTRTLPRNAEAKELAGVRKLRSGEMSEGSAKKQVTDSEETTRIEQKKSIELKTSRTKTIKAVEKLKTKPSEQAQNHQDENLTKTRNCKEGKNKDLTLRDAKDQEKNGTVGCSERSNRASEDVLKNVSMKAKSHGESRGEKKRSSTGKNAASSDSSNAGGKESAAASSQRGAALTRKVSSRKSVADEQGDTTSVQAASKNKHGRMARETSVSSTSRGVPPNRKRSEEKIDASRDTVEPKGVKRRLTWEESRTQENGLDFGTSATSRVNPFVISRAQTRFFSSRIKEQTRRTWEQKQKMHMAKAGRRTCLKSGNTVSMANVSIDSATNAVGEGSKRTGKSALSVSFDNGPVTFAAESSGSESSSGAPPSGLSLVDSTHTHLSPKQMLSVLESTKWSTCPSKGKTRKESSSADTSSHGSSARKTVQSSWATKTVTSSGLGSSVTSDSHRPSSTTGATDPATPERRAGVQKTPVKLLPSQAASAETITNRKTPGKGRALKRQSKAGGERRALSEPDRQTSLATKAASEGPGSNSLTRKRGRPRKILRV